MITIRKSTGRLIRVTMVCGALLAGCRATVTQQGAPDANLARLVAQGDSIFHARACQRCHGADARGTRNGPNLRDSVWLHADGSYESIVRVITDGVPLENIRDSTHALEMQPRGGRRNPLTDAQIRAVAAYIHAMHLPAAR